MKDLDETGPGGGSRARGFCKCPVCGYETVHHQDESCLALRCPECGSQLVRDLQV